MNRPLQEFYDHFIGELKEQRRLFDIAEAGGSATRKAAHQRGVLCYTHVLTRLATLYADQLDFVVKLATPSPVEQFLAEQRGPVTDPPVVVCQPTPEPVAPVLDWTSEVPLAGCTSYHAAVRSDLEFPWYYRVRKGTLGWNINESRPELISHLSADDRARVFDLPTQAMSFCESLAAQSLDVAEEEPTTEPTAEPVAVAEECPLLEWTEHDDHRNHYRGVPPMHWTEYRAVSAALKSEGRGPIYRVKNSTSGWRFSDTQNELKHHLSEEEMFQTFPSPAAAKAFCQELEQNHWNAKAPAEEPTTMSEPIRSQAPDRRS